MSAPHRRQRGGRLGPPVHAPTNHRGPVRSVCLGVWLFGGLGALSMPSVRAQPALIDPAAQGHLQAGLAALQRQDLKKAQRELESGYLREPSALLLEPMGQVAERGGDPVAAADLYRRFLEEFPEAGAGRPQLTKLITQVRSSAVEVAISGEPAAWLRVDGRLVGRLPLGRALLLSPGRHQLTHEAGGKATSYKLNAQPGVPIGLRFVPDSAHIAVETRPPVVLVSFDGQARPGPGNAALARAALLGLRQDGQAYDLDPEQLPEAIGGRSAPPRCFAEPSCLTQAARQLGAHGVLRLSSGSPPQLTYLDARVGLQSEQAAIVCSGCSPERQAAATQAAAQALITSALNRAYGTLELRVQPSRAAIRIDGAGTSRSAHAPARIESLAGPLSVTVQSPGYLPARAALEVPVDGVRTLDLTLRPNPLLATVHKVRIAKWCLLSAGLLGIAGGAAGLALHERFKREVGDSPGHWEIFTSQTQGAILLSMGVGAVGGAIGLSVYERRLVRQAAADEESALRAPSLLSLALSGAR